MRPISFIYFDLDDTLLDHSRAEMLALGDVYSRYSDSLGVSDFSSLHDAYREINSTIWRSYSDGDLTKDEAKQKRFARLISRFEPVVAGLSAEDLSDYYMSRYSMYWSYVPGARESIVSISTMYPLGILTNGFSEVQHRKLSQFPEVRDACRTVVISDEVGCMKPHPEIFTYATDLVGFPRDEILYVGDSLRSDIKGGLEAGWQVAWYTEDCSEAPEVFSFSQWSDLSRRLQALYNRTPE
jgi:pyrimidine 5'-nucleotidase